MRLTKLNIENFRGFENCNIPFKADLNVFIGANGSGKTSLLDAITKSLYKITRQFVPLERPVKELLLNETDINYKYAYCQFLYRIIKTL